MTKDIKESYSATIKNEESKLEKINQKLNNSLDDINDKMENVKSNMHHKVKTDEEIHEDLTFNIQDLLDESEYFINESENRRKIINRISDLDEILTKMFASEHHYNLNNYNSDTDPDTESDTNNNNHKNSTYKKLKIPPHIHTAKITKKKSNRIL